MSSDCFRTKKCGRLSVQIFDPSILELREAAGFKNVNMEINSEEIIYLLFLIYC